MNKRKVIVAVVTLLLATVAIFFGITYTEDDVNKISDAVETVVNIVEEVQATTEIPNLTEEDEQVLEVQEADLEADSFAEKSDVAYESADKMPSVETGKYQGLTYYSQADSRWANHKYSAINDKSQTIKSSGCGPTCSAMVVSSIKGTITPDTIRRFIRIIWIQKH